MASNVEELEAIAERLAEAAASGALPYPGRARVVPIGERVGTRP